MEFVLYCLACYLVAFALHHRKRIAAYVRKEVSLPPDPVIRNPKPNAKAAYDYNGRVAYMRHLVDQQRYYVSKEEMEDALGCYLNELEIQVYRDMVRGATNEGIRYDAFDPNIPLGAERERRPGAIGAVGVTVTRPHGLYHRMFVDPYDDPYGDFGYFDHGNRDSRIDRPRKKATKSLIDQLEAS